MFSLRSAEMRTIKDLDDSGLDLRLWCYRCERAATIDAIIWWQFEARGWAMEISDARKRFRCRRCKSSADVLLVAATRAPQLPITGDRVVERWFHDLRAKKRRS